MVYTIFLEFTKNAEKLLGQFWGFPIFFGWVKIPDNIPKLGVQVSYSPLNDRTKGNFSSTYLINRKRGVVQSKYFQLHNQIA